MVERYQIIIPRSQRKIFKKYIGTYISEYEFNFFLEWTLFYTRTRSEQLNWAGDGELASVAYRDPDRETLRKISAFYTKELL